MGFGDGLYLLVDLARMCNELHTSPRARTAAHIISPVLPQARQHRLDLELTANQAVRGSAERESSRTGTLAELKVVRHAAHFLEFVHHARHDDSRQLCWAIRSVLQVSRLTSSPVVVLPVS